MNNGGIHYEQLETGNYYKATVYRQYQKELCVQCFHWSFGRSSGLRLRGTLRALSQKHTWNERKSGMSFARILTHTHAHTQKNDQWHKLLSKRNYLVCYYLRCHSTWFGLTEWSRSEKVMNILKSTSPTVGSSLDSSIFGCYVRVTPRVSPHMRNALTLSL